MRVCVCVCINVVFVCVCDIHSCFGWTIRHVHVSLFMCVLQMTIGSLCRPLYIL